MKKLAFLALSVGFSLFAAGSACGQVLVENTDLKGDTQFVEKIKGLDTETVDKALYVSPTGSDSNEGTISAPFKTINAALDSAQPGTTVYVRAGEYKENVYFPTNGRADAYITLANYPGEAPVLKGTGINDKAIIELDGHDYIRIEGLELCDYTAKWCYGIIFAGGENHIIIRNNKIHDINCSKPSDPDNSGANGILLFGEAKEPISNVYIAHNEISSLTTGWCEALSVTANCEYVNVINNIVHDCTNIGIDFYGNNADGYCPVAELNQPRYCLAAGNEVYGCVCSYATSYGIYADGARDIVIENNISHNNQGGIEIGSEERNESYPVKNIIVRNNLVYDNTENGITVGGWNDGSSAGDALSGVVYSTGVYNNTVLNNGSSGAGQMHIAMVDGLDARNNIFYSNNSNEPLVASDVAKEQIKNLTFANNLYYTEGVPDTEAYFELMEAEQTGMSQWRSLTAENGNYADPEFKDSYRISDSSPAVNTGDSSADFGKYDLDNNPRVYAAVDIGAFENQGEAHLDPTPLLGDADNSGQLTSNDAAQILAKSVDKSYLTALERAFPNAWQYLDVTGDGSVAPEDAAAVLSLVLG